MQSKSIRLRKKGDMNRENKPFFDRPSIFGSAASRWLWLQGGPTSGRS
jgi:hypothetical protein